MLSRSADPRCSRPGRRRLCTTCSTPGGAYPIALSRPDEVLDFLRSFFRTARQAAFLPRLAEALAESTFLHENGCRLAEEEPNEE